MMNKFDFIEEDGELFLMNDGVPYSWKNQSKEILEILNAQHREIIHLQHLLQSQRPYDDKIISHILYDPFQEVKNKKKTNRVWFSKEKSALDVLKSKDL